MTPRRPLNPRGFTLIEMMGTLVVVGAVAAVVSPMVLKSSEAFARSASQRRTCEQVSLALDRLTKTLREAPSKSGVAGATDFSQASATAFTLGNGNSVEVSSGSLILGSDTIKSVPICRNVTDFSLAYFDGAGASVNVASGTDTVRRVHISLTADGVSLSTTVWLRAGMQE